MKVARHLLKPNIEAKGLKMNSIEILFAMEYVLHIANKYNPRQSMPFMITQKLNELSNFLNYCRIKRFGIFYSYEPNAFEILRAIILKCYLIFIRRLY